ncbi:hypothetical protein VZT92_016580 [Zoarces viviparus]|uniref:Uncharacterized protein n=1 Tax=Zoarces viviparus TaxID=48416 RepID=A0AAW1EX44_ZOAVI
MSISPAHRTPDACPNRTTNGCRPAVFNTVWDRALLLSPALGIHRDRRRPSGQGKKKTASPYASTPRGLEPSVTPLPTSQWGIIPTAPTLPRPEAERRRYGTAPLGFVPLSRRGYLLRAREQGRAWD